MKKVFSFIGCALCLFFIHSAQAQTIENVVTEFDGENVSITYDLIHTTFDQKFLVSLYSSHNNFQSSLQLVTGDVGNDILPGTDKKVVWDVKNELPPYFNDELSFKVKALLIEAPITQIPAKEDLTLNVEKEIDYIIKPLQNTAFKKGSKLELKWEGGATSDRIKIDLLKNNVIQQTLSQGKNTNAYLWNIPSNNKPGNYTLKISNAVNPKINAISQQFKIKPKIPLLAKIGIPIVVGVLVGVLAGGGGGGEDPVRDDSLSDLPGPISPGGG